MLKEKFEVLQKKANKEEIDLIIKNDEMLAVLKGLIELKLNRITLIQQLDVSKDWYISLKCNELEYEKLITTMKDFQIWTVEEDRFGRLFNKRLGA